MARQVDLRKENFPRLPFERSPNFDFPLQRAQLPFLKLSLMLPAQMINDRLRLDRGVAFKQLHAVDRLGVNDVVVASVVGSERRVREIYKAHNARQIDELILARWTGFTRAFGASRFFDIYHR